ncbi:kyphoscoliosis [Sarcoptes scabiei]|nr:kyphoscoliosis [Sarcoptes scabiei]
MENFMQYKRFCFDKINDHCLPIDIKITVMRQIIENLFEQNEQLINITEEINQFSRVQSDRIHGFLQRTANQTIEIGETLSLFELRVKNFTMNYLPSLMENSFVLDQIDLIINYYRIRNSRLSFDNQKLAEENHRMRSNMDFYKWNNDSLSFGQEFSKDPIFNNQAIREEFLKDFINDKLNKQEDNINSVICATILDEIIYKIESEPDSMDYEDSLESIELLTKSTDLNDQSDVLENFWNNNVDFLSIKSEYRFLRLLSIFIEEIRHRNKAMERIRIDLENKRKCFHSLRNCFIEYRYRFIDHIFDVLDLNQIIENQLIDSIFSFDSQIENEIRQFDFDRYRSHPIDVEHSLSEFSIEATSTSDCDCNQNENP